MSNFDGELPPLRWELFTRDQSEDLLDLAHHHLHAISEHGLAPFRLLYLLMILLLVFAPDDLPSTLNLHHDLDH